MKRLGKIVVCLAGGLVLNAGARADDVVLPNNPYAPIVVRNVFGLNPPQPVDPNATQADPPPKITPNGIMSIFGQLQVLFKVAGTAKPGQPAKDESYILSEGQRQDEIEVIQIDEKASLVTFNNHGTVQEIPLAKANAPAVNTPPAARAGRFQSGILQRPMARTAAEFPAVLAAVPPAVPARHEIAAWVVVQPLPTCFPPSAIPANNSQNTMTPEAQMHYDCSPTDAQSTARRERSHCRQYI